MSDNCTNIGFVLKILAKVLTYVKVIVPMLLIVLIIFDLFKAFVGNIDDKAKKDAISKAAKRLIYAIIVFLIPAVINVIFRAVDDSRNNNGQAVDWISCWTRYYK